MNAFRACATNESDTRKVMGMVQANDDALKAKIETVVAQIEATVVQAKADMQQLTGTVDTKIRELQTAQAQGVAAPPGATVAAGGPWSLARRGCQPEESVRAARAESSTPA